MSIIIIDLMAVFSVWDFINSNFVASLFGSFLAAVFFWLLFEKKIRNLIKLKEDRRTCEHLLGDLLYNRILAENNIQKTTSFTVGKMMTILKFETDGLDRFIVKKPIDMGDGFYGRLQVFSSSNLKSSNMLLNIFWFSPALTEADRTITKKEFLKNSNTILTEIDRVLANPKFISYMKSFGLTDDIKPIASEDH